MNERASAQNLVEGLIIRVGGSEWRELPPHHEVSLEQKEGHTRVSDRIRLLATDKLTKERVLESIQGLFLESMRRECKEV